MFLLIYAVLTYQVSVAGGQNVSFGLDSVSWTLGCFISPFSKSDAVWNRNGTLMTQCTDTGFCTAVSTQIGNITYSFMGNGSGIFVSVNSPLKELGVKWSCIHKSRTYTFVFDITSSGNSGGLLTVETFFIILGVCASTMYGIV